MTFPRRSTLGTAAALACGLAGPAGAAPFVFSTGGVNGLIATASRPNPSSGPNLETESADDFVISGARTQVNSGSFTGLVPAGASIAGVTVEMYRVFQNDSNTGRTSGPPTFSTPQVPTRVNSPSDVALDSRSSGSGLSYITAVLAPSFTAPNSVDTGINPKPGQTTGGEGPVTGQEVQFNVTFTSPFTLDPDHYFFVPQVLLADPAQHFRWLSASRPIDATGTPFALGTTDLQAWIRNSGLDPDWLRIGTDVIGAGTFNMAFTLNGQTVPEPAAVAMLAAGLLGLAAARRPTGRRGR